MPYRGRLSSVQPEHNSPMLESKFWKLLKAHLPRSAFASRVESGYSTPGAPDLWVCMNGSQQWVELKVAKGTKILLTPQQVIWHRKCAAAGGSSWVAAWAPQDVLIWRGPDAERARNLGTLDADAVRLPISRVWEYILAPPPRKGG
jgi:hypothetical protein